MYKFILIKSESSKVKKTLLLENHLTCIQIWATPRQDEGIKHMCQGTEHGRYRSQGAKTPRRQHAVWSTTARWLWTHTEEEKTREQGWVGSHEERSCGDLALHAVWCHGEAQLFLRCIYVWCICIMLSLLPPFSPMLLSASSQIQG